MEQAAGAGWRVVHPDADGVAGAAGPQTVRALQRLLPVLVRGFVVPVVPSAQQLPAGLPQRLPDVPHVQSQGQSQHVRGRSSQGDGLPVQGLPLLLGLFLRLPDLLPGGRAAVIAAHDHAENLPAPAAAVLGASQPAPGRLTEAQFQHLCSLLLLPPTHHSPHHSGHGPGMLAKKRALSRFSYWVSVLSPASNSRMPPSTRSRLYPPPSLACRV